MNEEVDRSGCSLLWTVPVVGFALTVPGALLGQQQKEQEENEVTPTEDLDA